MSAPVSRLATPQLAADADLLDASRSPAVARELPGLATALDAAAMSECLNGALFAESAHHLIERCVPGHATYVPGQGCLVRYDVTVAGGGRTVVNGRIFRSSSECRRHFRDRLVPLAARAARRVLPAPVAMRVAAVDGLNLTVSRFPIDAELPALIDAADPAKVAPLLRSALGSRSGTCEVTLGHYGRRNRCVLRYELRGVASHSGVIYGKVAADGRGATAEAAIMALRPQLLRLPDNRRVTIPRSLGFHPAMELLLLEAVPGTPLLSSLLKSQPAGHRESRAAIERAVEACGEVAAALHESDVMFGPRRSGAQELAALGDAADAVRRITPLVGDRLSSALVEVDHRLAGSHPLAPRLCHGDFRQGQILFEGSARALVDFDTLCQAEPPLDLGHFLAYLRLSAAKGGVEDTADHLADRFLAAYVAAAGSPAAAETALRARVAVYEAVALIRLAIHSWQKFKPARLALALTLLEERLSCRTP